MPIEFTCACGRRLRVAEDVAGKRARCPACDAVSRVPASSAGRRGQPSRAASGPDAESPDLELVEDGSPADGGAPTETPPRKRKKRPPLGRETGMTALYMSDARQQQRRDVARVQGRTSRGDGLTIGNVHITAGVLGGCAMTTAGLIGLAIFAILASRNLIIIRPRFYIFTIVCLVGGIAVLVKAIVFGQED